MFALINIYPLICTGLYISFIQFCTSSSVESYLTYPI